MKPKPIGEVLRSAAWWLDVVERLGHSRDLLHNRMVELIGTVVHREDCTPEAALALLRSGYLFRAIENAINNENQPRRHQAAASKEKHTND